MKKIYLLLILSLLFINQINSQSHPSIKEEFALPEGIESPKSLAIDQFDNFYISEAYLVYKLDSQGKIIEVSGGRGDEEDKFREIEDIRVKGLNLFVADSRNNRIVILDKYLNRVSQIHLTYQDEDLYPTSLCLTTSNQFWVKTSNKQGLFKLRSSRGVPEFYSFNFYGKVQLEPSQEDGIWVFSPKQAFLQVTPFGGVERRYSTTFLKNPEFFTKNGDQLTFLSFDERLIYLTNADLKDSKKFIYPLEESPIDVFFKNGRLFVLLDDRVVKIVLK